MPDETILTVEDDGAVRILTMNRPDKLNALDTALTQALVDSLKAADADPDVRAIVLTGAGRGFCAGADTSEFKDLRPENGHLVVARADLTARLQSLFREVRKPIVAAARGVAVGGGAGLALAADMLMAGQDLKFGYPELKHGLVPALVMTNLVRQMGRKLAFELISTGRLLTGQAMVEFGLANRVVAPDEVMAAALETARLWAKASPEAMSAAKSLFHQVSELPFEAGMVAGRDVNIKMRGFSRP